MSGLSTSLGRIHIVVNVEWHKWQCMLWVSRPTSVASTTRWCSCCSCSRDLVVSAMPCCARRWWDSHSSCSKNMATFPKPFVTSYPLPKQISLIRTRCVGVLKENADAFHWLLVPQYYTSSCLIGFHSIISGSKTHLPYMVH